MPDDSGELVFTDLTAFTQGRLSGDEAQVALTGALAAVRRYCGWHVSPVRATTVDLDGPGSQLLVLPTLRLVGLTSVIENGTLLNLGVEVYASARGLVRKRNGAYWSANYGAITVEMTHGFDDAADFNAAVLSFADRSSLIGVGGRPTVVGPFQYGTEAMAGGSAFSAVERALLDHYRLESPA